MSLPKIELPVFTATIPSTGKQVRLRVMKYKEEKILMFAKEDNSFGAKYNALVQIVNNCLVSEGIDVMNLALFDLEYLFLQIRANSVSDKASVQYRDAEDDKVRKFDIDLKKVVVTEARPTNRFEIQNGMYMTLRFPPVSLYTNQEFFDLTETDAFNKIMTTCMDKIFEGDKVYNCKDSKSEELAEFLESIPAKTFAEIQKYFGEIPTLYYAIEYKNDNETDRKIELRSLSDFFTF